MKKPNPIVCILLTTVLLGACGGSQMKSRFPENDEQQLAMVLEKISVRATALQESRPFLSVVLEGGDGIKFIDLSSGKTLWERKDIQVSSAPAVGEGAVLLRSGDKIVALSTGTGSTLWKKSVKENYLYGFAFDSGRVFVTMGNTNGGSPATGRTGMIVAYDAGSGGKKWSIKAGKMLGAPAAAGGLVFVPWDRQAISIFDGESGKEVCRLIRKDSTVDFIITGAGGVYYGSARDIQKLTKESASGTKTEGTTFEFDVKEMPGSPRIYPDGYVESSFEGGAFARNRLLWSIGKGKGDIGLDQDMIYLVFYRYVVGFNALEKLPLWVHMSEAQIATSHAAGDGVLLLGMDGMLTYVDGKTGSSKTMWKENFSPHNAYFQTAGFTLPQVEIKEPNLHRGLVDMILDVDTQVLPLRKYGMKLLALIPDDMVTLDLVQVMSSPDLPKSLRDEAARLLRSRKGGVEFLIEALDQHHNFLEDTSAPPSGAIASSLVESNEKKAVPLLIDHLKDHETPAEELVELTAAIVELGDKKAYKPLKRFLLMYHGDSSMSQHANAMVNVARGVLKFGGEEGRDIVETIAGDPISPESLRFQLADLLKTGIDEPEEKEEQSEEGEEEVEEEEEVEVEVE